MGSLALKRQVVSPRSARLPEEVTVVEKSWSSGLKNPPTLQVELSDGNMLHITIDDLLETKTLRLFVGGGDCVGVEVFPWRTGIDGEILDGLLEEVRASNHEWWAESGS